MLATQSLLIRSSLLVTAVLGAEKDFGANDQILSSPHAPLNARCNDLPHEFLRLSPGVRLGSVEEVDASLESSLHDGVRLFEIQLRVERDEASERHLRDQQPRVAQETVLHVAIACRLG
ncbi:hypothetical protein PF005_g2395 [Phytophthora fragariae]|uniref:Secreted protein n=1 Tax=Phytophthora fragariae TaxID=53985 RepID=A0A6A3ZE44_9STRA|nr:hypothetical protein PF009_g2578 [Phytophthora fragariae]KAE9028188.1 hypothetical protein PF011_g1685 [Phytophthora fragariae]KAE9135769.1 hypothetical protein PF010_g1933 [Phytophthora fragariae]KAE9136024.1 hypothetical protein PF007_g2351 [Phytophthora fragariae]KAE9154177.1 hypothetical protein PF006_g1767 [Phytophthora fragariae]